jgi:hypothetical protein
MSETTDGPGPEGQLVAADLEIRYPPPEWEMPLRKPVEHLGETFTSLQLRELTDDQWGLVMEAAEGGPRRRKAISLASGVPEGAIAKMGIGDTARAEAYLVSFFDIAQVIGVG